MSEDIKSLLVITGCVLLMLVPAGFINMLTWPILIIVAIWAYSSISDSFYEAEKTKERETNARHQAIIDAIHASQPISYNPELYGPPE